VTLSVLNQHLDKGCEASESIQSPRNGITSAGKGNWFQKPIKVNAKTSNAPRSKLPRPNYGVMKEAEIRKMLADLQLSKNGSKDRIVERHRQWVTLYNANLDASPKVQKTDLQLRRELAEWDRAFDESQRKTKPMNEEAAKVYQEVNQGQFNDLIKTARETHAKNKAAHHQKGTQEEQTSNGSQSKPSSSSPTG
jgi:E3 ubiquitin-protein ligase RAD18